MDHASAPTIVDNTIYRGGGDGHLYAVDIRTGKDKWRFKTDGEILSTPVVAGETVFVGSDDGHLYAIDSRTGKQQWQFKTGGLVHSNPAVADGTSLSEATMARSTQWIA